jgi:hypothetical protein
MPAPQYPITEIYAWVIDDPSCHLGIIGMMPLDGTPMQAISSRRHVIENPIFRAFAESVAKQTGFPVRLQRFILADTVTQLDPS